MGFLAEVLIFDISDMAALGWSDSLHGGSASKSKYSRTRQRCMDFYDFSSPVTLHDCTGQSQTHPESGKEPKIPHFNERNIKFFDEIFLNHQKCL